jgi:predicted transporter
MKSLFWDKENQSIRGSFVNLILTLTILGMIVAGTTSDEIMNRVEKLSTLILGFFATSIGVWTYKKIAEGKQEPKDGQTSAQ